MAAIFAREHDHDRCQSVYLSGFEDTPELRFPADNRDLDHDITLPNKAFDDARVKVVSRGLEKTRAVADNAKNLQASNGTQLAARFDVCNDQKFVVSGPG
jgi:hypothetical protein